MPDNKICILQLSDQIRAYIIQYALLAAEKEYKRWSSIKIMRDQAGDNLTVRLDAITYRSRGPNAFYVSEHGPSTARDLGFESSLKRLSMEIRREIRNGVYQLPDRVYLRTFVTMIRVSLPLRDGGRMQLFPCRVDEVEDTAGRRSFEASCPTNYLQDSGKTINEAIAGLRDVIIARYRGESVYDLMRELPKCPIMTAIDILPGSTAMVALKDVAIITPLDDGGFAARSRMIGGSVRGGDPYVALRHLELSIADSTDFAAARNHQVKTGEPAFCMLDVPLSLRDGRLIQRFLVAISSWADDSTGLVFTACAPQAGEVSFRSSSGFDATLDGISYAIALEFEGKSQKEVRDALTMPFFMATLMLPVL
ncbi:MAG TPA: hypothetical protein VK436_01910 [Methanocella sp.]|nr:hypothetical protein [Methanocella sp.]